MTPQYVFQVSYRRDGHHRWEISSPSYAYGEVFPFEAEAKQAYMEFVMSDYFEGEARLAKGIISPNTGEFRSMYILEYYRR